MTDSISISIRPLQPQDNRRHFQSGDIELDRFFRKYAGQNQFRHHIGSSYIAVTGEHICGFVTVSAGEITAENIPASLQKRLPSYPLPILRIARLAVDQRFQGLGIGRLLLKSMLTLALKMRDQTGCIGVAVDAKPAAVTFYRNLGFEALEIIQGALGERPEPVTLFLPIRQIELACGPEVK